MNSVRLFCEVVALTVVGILFVAAKALSFPGDLVFALARAIFEMIDRGHR